MSSTNYFTPFFNSFLSQIPVFLAALAGLVFVLVKWRQGSRGSMWALMGFGLALALTFLVPLGNVVVQTLAVRNAVSSRDMASTYTTLGTVWGLLRATSYVFLLIAVFAGRPPVAEASR